MWASFLSQNQLSVSNVSNFNMTQYQAQQVNSFIPPTRASQGLNPIKKAGSQNMQIASSGKIQPKLDFSFDDRNDDQRNLPSEEEKEDLFASENKRYRDLVENGEGPGTSLIDDDNQFIKKEQINKVNEMDVKQSRFEQALNPFHEEFIPNEEPLIKVREFNGIGATNQQAPKHLR